MAKLKILAVSYLFPNIVSPNHGVFVYNRLNALSKLVDIKVINPIPWSPLHRLFPQYSSLSRVPRHTRLGNLEVFHPRFLSIPKYLKNIESVTYQSAIEKVLKNDLTDFNFDIIDLHWTFPDLPAGAKLALKYKSPLMVTLRGMEALHLQDDDIRTQLVRKYLKRPQEIIALSEELKSASIQMGADPEKHNVIRNGVDSEKFLHIDRVQARQFLGISENETVILAVGALIRRKGFDLIIQALPEVIKKARGRMIKLYIVGSQGPEGDFRKSLYEYVRRFDLQDSVVFQGAVSNDDLIYWYNSADVFCLASRGEGSPNVLTEALACGCPAVATDVGAVRDIMTSEENLGICIPPEQVNSLAEALVEVILTNYDRVKNAKLYGQYSWDWCADKVLRVYQRIVNP